MSARLSSARDGDEFVVKEYEAEVAADVVILVDRRPSLRLFPDLLPWLHKPAAIERIGALILASAMDARCQFGYLDLATDQRTADEHAAGDFVWVPPDGRAQAWELEERYLSGREYVASDASMTRALEWLALEAHLARGSFLFVLSDYCAWPEAADNWLDALARRCDVVPVVIQDPTWEQSFPSVASTPIPIADPATGTVRVVRLTRSEVNQRRIENESRLRNLRQSFEVRELDWVLIGDDQPSAILDAFRSWAIARRGGFGALPW